MSDTESSGLMSMRRAITASALLLVALSLADWLGNVSSLRFSSVQWRYGAFGLLVNGLPVIVLGILIGCVAAVYYADRTAARLWAGLGYAVAIVLVAGLIMFALDSVQIRATVTPDRLNVWRLGVAVTVAKVLIDTVVLVLIGLGCLRGIPRDGKRSRSPAEVIIGKG